MKKSLLIGIIGILSLFFLVGCGNNAVDKISFKEKSITIEKGSSYTLELNENVKNVKFKSSDENIVLVNDNGYITGKNNGYATVTAYIEGMEDINDTCNVTVYTEQTIIYPQNISLNKTSINLKVGNNEKLSYTIEPSNANTNIKWETSNNKVATVNNGLVKAVGEGSATITVKTSNNLYATCSVSVSKNQVTTKYTLTYNANGGSVSPTSKTLNRGDKYGTLPTPTRSGYTFSGWYTEKNGGNKVGSNTTISSNTTIYAHWQKNKENVPVTSISLNKTSANVKTKRSIKLVATITPSNASNKTITWTSSDTSIAKVDKEGKVTGLKIGEATITATSNNGKKASAKIKVNPLTILIVGNSKTFRTNDKDKRPSFNFVDIAYKGKYLNNSSSKIETKAKDKSIFIGVHKNVTITAKNGSYFATRTVSPFKEYILARNFDVIILQEKTAIAAGTDFNKYYDDTKKFVELIGGKNYKGRLYFRTSWPLKSSDFEKDLKAMNSNTEKVASKINKDYGIKTYVIHDGNAFKKALNNKIEVYVPDNNHQNINGAYLSALCMYVKVYNEDATKVTTNLYVTDKTIANKLKNIANSECK
jgi:uncharacterized repeat protein (TIGR02543 family)